MNGLLCSKQPERVEARLIAFRYFLLWALSVVALAGSPVMAEDWSREGVLVFDTRKVLGALERALAVHDEIPTLEAKSILFRDQRSASSELDELVREAMSLFGSPVINGLRDQYRELEVKIAEEKRKLNSYRSERVLAVADGRSLRTRLLPGETLKSMVAVTRADYDMLIEVSQNNIAAFEQERARTIVEMSQALTAIGVDLNSDQLEALMSSVIGDGMVDMSVVFNAIKDMTNQLAILTQESGESLYHAKKYYGMVVILHRIIGTMQSSFIAEVDDKYQPRLQQYRQSAQSNISESRKLLKEGGNSETLNANIRSNELTIQAIDLYSGMLTSQRKKVAQAHKVTLREMSVAENTYQTVSVSSAVVGMIREGGKAFEQLMSMQMPDIREFKNDEIREEFKALTARMAI